MTVNQTPVKMVEHVWMESTRSPVDVNLGSLAKTVSKVCIPP